MTTTTSDALDERVLARMSPLHQQAVIFYHQLGRSQREISLVLGIHEATVRHILRQYQAMLTPGYETPAERREREREERWARQIEEAKRAEEERRRAEEEAEQAAARAFDPASVSPGVLRAAAAMRVDDPLTAMLPLYIRVKIVEWRRDRGARVKSAVSA